jgi:hypothetical protein
MGPEEKLKYEFDRYRRHIERKYKRQVEKQRQRLFGADQQHKNA